MNATTKQEILVDLGDAMTHLANALTAHGVKMDKHLDPLARCLLKARASIVRAQVALARGDE